MPGLISVVKASALLSPSEGSGSNLDKTVPSEQHFNGIEHKSNSSAENSASLSQPNMLINLLTQSAQQPKSTKRYQCDLCSYETDGKAQFMYHSSFHSQGGHGETYQCKRCNFSVTKKHLFKQHMRMHTGEDVASSSDDESMQDSSEHTQAVDLTKLPGTSGTSAHGPIDLDDVISASKVPNKTFTPSTLGQLPQSTISKQILKIQELRNASGRSGDKQKSRVEVPSVDADATCNPSSPSSKEEKCPYCPFETAKTDVLKEHLQCHICVSGEVNLANCDHCDFSIADETLLKEHVKIHFGLIKTGKRNVAFYTSYDNLEINSTEYRHIHNNETTTTVQSMKTLFSSKCGMENSSDKENKILVDVNTGQVLK